MPRSVRFVLPPVVLLVWAVSCAVFPDEAVLPSNGETPLGGAGDGHAGQAGGGVSGAGVAAGGSGTGGGGGLPPTEGGAGAGGAAGNNVGARGGEAGAPGCEAPTARAATLSADTWIEADQKIAQHEDDVVLRVSGGVEESRALLRFSIPAYPEGTQLLKATLVLAVESNDDEMLAERLFTLHELEQHFVADRTSWTNWSNGSSGKWMQEGGDFGPELASSGIPGGTMTGTVSFDVSDKVRSLIAPTAVPLSLILLEAGESPPAPAEVAFTAAEGDDSKQPSLQLELCLP